MGGGCGGVSTVSEQRRASRAPSILSKMHSRKIWSRSRVINYASRTILVRRFDGGKRREISHGLLGVSYRPDEKPRWRPRGAASSVVTASERASCAARWAANEIRFCHIISHIQSELLSEEVLMGGRLRDGSIAPLHLLGGNVMHGLGLILKRERDAEDSVEIQILHILWNLSDGRFGPSFLSISFRSDF